MSFNVFIFIIMNKNNDFDCFLSQIGGECGTLDKMPNNTILDINMYYPFKDDTKLNEYYRDVHNAGPYFDYFGNYKTYLQSDHIKTLFNQAREIAYKVFNLVMSTHIFQKLQRPIIIIDYTNFIRDKGCKNFFLTNINNIRDNHQYEISVRQNDDLMTTFLNQIRNYNKIIIRNDKTRTSYTTSDGNTLFINCYCYLEPLECSELFGHNEIEDMVIVYLFALFTHYMFDSVIFSQDNYSWSKTKTFLEMVEENLRNCFLNKTYGGIVRFISDKLDSSIVIRAKHPVKQMYDVVYN